MKRNKPIGINAQKLINIVVVFSLGRIYEKIRINISVINVFLIYIPSINDKDIIIEQIVIIPLRIRIRFTFSELKITQNARRYLPK
jgi:hypothetical protein